MASQFAVSLLWSGVLFGCRHTALQQTIVVIPHRDSGPLWLSEHVGITEAAARHGLLVTWHGPNDETLLDEQYELTERAIHQRAAGIILSPNVDHVFKRLLLQAHEQHIPVVIEGEAAGLQATSGVSFVLGNVDVTGRLIAERLAKALHHRAKVIIAGLDPRTPGSVERSDAVVAALTRSEQGLTVVDRIFGSASPARSQTLMEAALAAHPEAGAVVSLSAGESIAVVNAVRAAGRLGKLTIVGCDQSLPVFMLLRLGVLDSLVVEDNRRLGGMAVTVLTEMRAGEYDSRTVMVNPVLVTRDNIDTEPVQQVLLMHRGTP